MIATKRALITTTYKAKSYGCGREVDRVCPGDAVLDEALKIFQRGKAIRIRIYGYEITDPGDCPNKILLGTWKK